MRTLAECDKTAVAATEQGAMIGFDWWWGLLLLPLPALVRALVAEAKARQLALSVPLLTGRSFAVQSLGRTSLRPTGLCMWAFWVCLVLAASRPFWLGDPVSRTVSGRDLMLRGGSNVLSLGSSRRPRFLWSLIVESLEDQKGSRYF